MAIVLQLENLAATSTINLANATGIKFLSSGYEREMSYTVIGEDVVRVHRFIATSTTKALARTNLNAFVALLRQAIKWMDDDLEQSSIFLREQADGETAARMLVKGFEVRGVTPIAGLSPLQQLQKEIIFDVAFTLQNHREEPEKTNLTISDETDNYAIGKTFQIYGGLNSAPSRVFFKITSTLEGATLTKFWIGMMPWVDDNFQHIWECDHATTLYTDTTETTSTGSFGTNIAKVSFATNAGMAPRVLLNANDIYDAVGAPGGGYQTKGEFFILLRYKVDSGTGTIMTRIGVSGAANKSFSYNEARLVDSSGLWRFLPVGVVKFPPQGMRQETVSTNMVQTGCIMIDAQRLTGNCTIVFDSLTLIPYKHFLAVDNMRISSGLNLRVVTNELLDIVAFSEVAGETPTFSEPGNIVEQRNFLYPVGTYDSVDFRNQVVFAAERGTTQVYNDDLDNDTFSIYEAYEGYNG